MPVFVILGRLQNGQILKGCSRNRPVVFQHGKELIAAFLNLGFGQSDHMRPDNRRRRLTQGTGFDILPIIHNPPILHHDIDRDG